MNFLTMQQEVGAQCGLDYTDNAQGPLIQRWINTAQKYIYSQAPWPFLRASTPLAIQTVTDITTGTVATVAGSTTITFSSAPAVSVAGRYIQTSSGLDWYNITAHTAATTTATIEIAAITTASAATYIVRKFYYSTSALLDRILQINTSTAPYHLEERTKEVFDSNLFYQNTTGLPLIYMMTGLDSTGYWQFKLWPSPSAVQNLYVDYLVIGVDMSSNTDTSLMPEKWHRTAIVEGACFQGYRFLDDTRAGESKTLEKFLEPVIESMMDEMLPSTSLHRVLSSVDNTPMRNEFPLPVNYPNV